MRANSLSSGAFPSGMPKTPEFPDDYYLTREELEERMEGGPFDFNPSGKHWKCDWCSKGVPYSKSIRAGHYMCDDVVVVNNKKAQQVRSTRKLGQFATYCEDCTHRMLLFPCKGYTEIRLLFDTAEDGTMHNIEVTDISPQDDGIPWDPAEVSEAITQVSTEQIGFLAGEDVWAPENLVTFFLGVTDVDLRDLIDWEGNVNPKLLGRARRHYRKTAQQVSGKERRWRDVVRKR